MSLVALAINIKQVQNGAGRHEYYLKPHEIVEELKWHAFSQIQLYICTALIKTSVCLFLVRLVNKKVLVRLLYFLMFAVVSVNLAVLIVLVTQCRPFEKVWNRKLKGSCWSVDVLKDVGWVAGGDLPPLSPPDFYYLHHPDHAAGFAVATDLVCSLLPALFLRKVQINRRTKILICGLMATGLMYDPCCPPILRVLIATEQRDCFLHRQNGFASRAWSNRHYL